MAAGEATLVSDDAVSVGRRIKGLDGDQRRAQRRQKPLDAALERFAVDGYANATIEQICQEAEVGTRSYYELFDSKEACYLALLRQITDRLVAGVVESMRDAPADEGAATTRLLAVFAHSLIDDAPGQGDLRSGRRHLTGGRRPAPSQPALVGLVRRVDLAPIRRVVDAAGAPERLTPRAWPSG